MIRPLNKETAINAFARLGIASLLVAFTVAGCGGGSEDNRYSAPGIDSGSASATYQSKEPVSGEPDIAAARNLPLADDFDAARFLHRASFGPTLESLDHLQHLGYAQWIDAQMQLPPTFMLPITRQLSEPRWREHVNSWLVLSTLAEDQLRQRVAYALSEFFVVSGHGSLGDEQAALANYYDILIAHAFGNYRDLLEQVTLSPVMGDYLSMKGNRKPDSATNIRPDENYARELLQLFSIGLIELAIDGSPRLDSTGKTIPTYDQQVVEGFAHVFTGWHFNAVDHWDYPQNEDWFSPMQAYPDQHDNAAKTLLNGFRVPAGQSPGQDLKDALDNVFTHPNVGPFFARHMIRQLVTSNPSSNYVRRVAETFNADSHGTRGNIAAVVTAVLTDPEALDRSQQDSETFGKLREPLVRLIALWRAFDAKPDHPGFNYGWIENRLAQAPLQSPTVFNFFSPDFSQNGEIRDRKLVSPEFQIHNESTIIAITSTLLAHSIWINTASDSDPADAPVNIDRLIALDDDVEAQLKFLSQLMLTEPMSDGLRNAAVFLRDARKHNDAQIRAEELLFLFASAPEAAIQH